MRSSARQNRLIIASGCFGFVVDGRAGLPDPIFKHGFELISVFNPHDPTVLENHGVLPPVDPDSGTFRIKCAFSHGNYDDPIVYPAQIDRAHLHVYFGNRLANASSTLDSLAGSGDSTCQGGYLNRSAYWVPAMLARRYDATGNPIRDGSGNPVFNHVPPAATGTPNSQPDIYYKASTSSLASVQSMPLGLRFIAGDMHATPANPSQRGQHRWSCEQWPAGTPHQLSIPECPVGDVVNLMILFPMCWNGVDLDVPDHMSHMSNVVAQPNGSGGWNLVCPASHPVALTQVSYNLGYPVTAATAHPNGTSRGWRLSSDMYDTEQHPGGHSAHGDWFMAWNPEVMDTFIRHCIRAGRHCSNGDLGNGWRLLGPFTGSGTMPPVVRCGLGPRGMPNCR